MRAISEASIEAGTTDCDRLPFSAQECSCSVSASDSITVRVTSSRNSGLPAARSRMRHSSSGGIALSCATTRMKRSDSAAGSASSSMWLRLPAACQLGWNSGRAVSSAISGERSGELSSCLIISTLVASAQCMSSTISSTGLRAANAWKASSSRSSVRCSARTGDRSGAGQSAGSTSMASAEASKGTTSAGSSSSNSARLARQAICAAGGMSARPNLAETNSMKGYSVVSVVKGVHLATSTSASRPARVSCTTWISRDLPMPGSPRSKANCGVPACTSCQIALIRARSRSRPM